MERHLGPSYSGARVGYLGSRLGVGKGEEEAPINKALEFPSGLRQFLAGPRGRAVGWHWQSCFCFGGHMLF